MRRGRGSGRSERERIADLPTLPSAPDRVSFKSVNSLRTNLALRAVATIVALFAWLVLSNHCALASHFPAPSSAESSCCKGHAAPADGNVPCPQFPDGCCKSLKIAMPDSAKIPHATATQLLPIVAEFLVIFALPLPLEVSALAVDGRPPDSPTFAELVLNRSLLSHAPPVFA
jgi:hypothetical protein